MDFYDLEVFADNCYSYEKNDVVQVLNWLERKIDLTSCSLHLVGHSRGGGIALLSSGDNRVSSVTTLAAISSIEKRFAFEKNVMDTWQRSGVRYIRNSRTNQDLPHNFSQYLDFQKNNEALSIQKACEVLKKPLLLIHGDKDESVNISEGHDLSKWTGKELTVVRNATHTFGGSHPHMDKALPGHLEDCCERILEFLQNNQF
jgi:pimeloyl-ACP methyl ester carboxylesterase